MMRVRLRPYRWASQWVSLMNIRHAGPALAVAALLVGAGIAPAAAAVINGTTGADVLAGTAAADTIRGYAGPDTVHAGPGADKVYGGDGADRLFPGNDKVNDVLYGGRGPDRIFVRGDTAHGGYGNDTIVVAQNPGGGWFSLYCGPGHDTVYAPSAWLLKNSSGCEKWIWTAK